ncbi:Uncharacterized protein APZ42_015731 [Daphnia magna]|uniref:Reverse transcriptase Ty1/copia-type domain-containing protein n=1 Tax=Daphnia magna TaxID=35525 RepID=A0A162NPQ9_9CRUS|nr:Uncharacterized protein APZ42_015731 [Daphnia magna]
MAFSKQIGVHLFVQDTVPTDFYTEQLITSQIPINEEFSPEPDATKYFQQKRFLKLNQERRPPVRWADESLTGIYAKLAGIDDLTEPAAYEEVFSSAQPTNWIAAMNDEMDSLSKNETWFLTHLPVGRASIKNRWVFKLKRSGPEGVKFKAKMVAK